MTTKIKICGLTREQDALFCADKGADFLGFITTPMENAIAQANGIDYMTSTSTSGTSTIMVYLRLNYDADKALTEINTKISSVLSQLPPGTQQPCRARGS